LYSAAVGLFHVRFTAVVRITQGSDYSEVATRHIITEYATSHGVNCYV